MELREVSEPKKETGPSDWLHLIFLYWFFIPEQNHRFEYRFSFSLFAAFVFISVDSVFRGLKLPISL